MISLYSEKCSGCRRCEVHCSFFHSFSIGRSASRIKVVKIEELGIDFPVFCGHCSERYCTKCPEGAITVGHLGQVVIDRTICTGCGTCETLCPVGAIELHEDAPQVCDLCDGDPRCVKACTMEAIRYEPERQAVVRLKVFKKGSRGLNPEEKRRQYALACFQAIRERWVSERSG